MNRENFKWKVIGVGVTTLIFYLLAFWGLEWWRARQGPWEVTFLSGPNTPPTLLIKQTRLGINEVRVVFEGEAAPATNLLLRFNEPVRTVPWGTVAHQDPVTFPGVVTLHLFGHEVEMMPRALSLNRKEIPWAPHAACRLRPQDKLPPDQLIRQKFQREIGRP